MTKFSDLVEEGLSYLQLFLELPETVWSLQNRSYIKKYYFFTSVSGFVLLNLTFGLIYTLMALKRKLFHVEGLVASSDGSFGDDRIRNAVNEGLGKSSHWSWVHSLTTRAE